MGSLTVTACAGSLDEGRLAALGHELLPPAGDLATRQPADQRTATNTATGELLDHGPNGHDIAREPARHCHPPTSTEQPAIGASLSHDMVNTGRHDGQNHF